MEARQGERSRNTQTLSFFKERETFSKQKIADLQRTCRVQEQALGEKSSQAKFGKWSKERGTPQPRNFIPPREQPAREYFPSKISFAEGPSLTPESS